jgi:hypothetical protein
MRNQPSFLMVQDDCPATLCKRWPTAPASAADGVDRGLPNSRLHLIERRPGGSGQARQFSCQIFCHRRIYADSRRHRQQFISVARYRRRSSGSSRKIIGRHPLAPRSEDDYIAARLHPNYGGVGGCGRGCTCLQTKVVRERSAKGW